MSKGGGPNVAEFQKEIEMLKKVVADKDAELVAIREQLDAKEDAMNRLEAEVSHTHITHAHFLALFTPHAHARRWTRFRSRTSASSTSFTTKM
jgi:hypothetical protein